MAVESLRLVCLISEDSSKIEMKELVVGNNLATCVKKPCCCNLIDLDIVRSRASVTQAII